MNQKSPKKKKRLPKDALERDDHGLMECIFGKKVMKEVDKVVAERCEESKGVK